MSPPALLQVSRMARAMAHEVTNPLAGLLSVAEVLQEGRALTAETAARYGRLIEQTLDRLEGLTRDLRLIANLPEAAAPVDLEAALTQAEVPGAETTGAVEVLADVDALHEALRRFRQATGDAPPRVATSRPHRFVVQLSLSPLRPEAAGEVAARMEAAGARVLPDEDPDRLTLRLAVPLDAAEV